MGSMSVSLCRCCMFVSCVHPVAVLNAAFCMTCCLLMLVEDAIGDHAEEAYYRARQITYVISLCDLACYIFGQEPAIAVHLALWYVVLVCHLYDVCENSIGGLSESGLCVLL